MAFFLRRRKRTAVGTEDLAREEVFLPWTVILHLAPPVPNAGGYSLVIIDPLRGILPFDQ